MAPKLSARNAVPTTACAKLAANVAASGNATWRAFCVASLGSHRSGNSQSQRWYRWLIDGCSRSATASLAAKAFLLVGGLRRPGSNARQAHRFHDAIAHRADVCAAESGLMLATLVFPVAASVQNESAIWPAKSVPAHPNRAQTLAWRITANNGTANMVALRNGDCCGSNAGKTNRVTASATSSPTIVNSPNWAKPVKLENNMALKPQTDVSMPSRRVGPMWRSVATG